MIEDAKELADYYEDLVDKITQFSFVVNKDGTFSAGNSTFKELSFSKFVEKSSNILRKFITSQQDKNRLDSLQGDDQLVT